VTPGADTTSLATSWASELELPAEVGLVARIVRLNLLVTSTLDEIAGAAGLSVGDYLVLAVLRRSPGRCSTPTRICEVLNRTTGGMTLTIDRLQAAGLLRRSPDPSDRRRVAVELTATGIDLSTHVNDQLHEWECSLGLSADERELVEEAIDSLLVRIEDARPQ
jgi:DNA-binding MarR family transcriptional regulator